MITDNLAQARFNMVQQQIRPWEVFDQRVLMLIDTLPRDAFVPEQFQQLAYSDIEIPLGDGQQMMFPRVEARLLQALDIQPTDNILEVGTGSGYLTACLAKLGGKVTSLEIRPDLSVQAGARLKANGVTNVELRTGDALSGVIDGGPFDVIAVTGSLPEGSDLLKRQLKPGGRMFAVSGEGTVMEATLITRTGEDSWHTEDLFETQLAALDNAPQPDHFRF